MNKIVKISPEIDEVKLSKAEECHKEVLARTIITANNLLELGKLFKTIRDEKLYKLLGAETFNEYCGFPEISFGRSTIYSFIHIFEKFVLGYGIGQEKLSKIGHRKLQIISPMCKYDEDIYEWIANAEVLSESDLINEVRRVQGKPDMIPKPKEEKNEEIYPFTFQDYYTFVKEHPCLLHPSRRSDPAHFPKTKGAGAPKEWVIPLCRECHSEQESNQYDFLWLYKEKIFAYFYDMFLKCFEVLRINKE